MVGHTYRGASWGALFIALMPYASQAVEFRTVLTKPTAAINLQGVSKKTFRNLRMNAPASFELRQAVDVTISACELPLIKLANCKRVKIYNCWLHDSERVAISLENCEDVVVQGCRIERVSSGVYALNCRGVQVIGNYVEDVVGPMPRGQLVQFNQVRGAENCVRDNYGINHRARSSPEDMISVYKSEGTRDSPIVIEGNYLCGDPQDGSADKSKSGSGIMLGDGGGKHIVCRNNILVNPGQCGIGVCGGEEIVVEGNVVSGRPSNVSNVGIYVWNQSKLPGARISVRANRVAWRKSDGVMNSFWQSNDGGFGEIELAGNEFKLVELLDNQPPPPTIVPLPPRPFGEPAIVPWKVDKS